MIVWSACVPTSFRGTADPVVAIADLALCVCVCAGSYVTVVCGSWFQHSPDSVQRRASRKAATYLVNALVTYGPIFLCFVDFHLLRNSTVYNSAWVFELLGGLFNTLTYAMQSRYAAALLGQSTLVREHPNALQRPSCDVAFVDDVELDTWPSSFGQSNSFQAQCPPSTGIEAPVAPDIQVGNSRFLFIRET